MIVIIDFGSQYNQLIARRVRECRVYCQIAPPSVSADHIRSLMPQGIILSGGPASIYEKNSPRIDPQIFDLDIPVLGICYGMQFMIDALGGVVKRAAKREYGFATLNIPQPQGLFKGIDQTTPCWMSHGDSIERLPEGFAATASTDNTPFASAADPDKRLYGLQFHPEVVHTPKGKAMLANFLFGICGCKRTWTMKSFAREAIGSHLTCIFVDNGLLRKDEAEKLKTVMKQHLHINIRFVSAKRKFLQALANISDPEAKRKIIGRLFMEVFEAEACRIKGAQFLAQGTLYPDVIESVSAFGGPSAVIKSHHNVGGLPAKMKLKLIEPLKYLFKDAVSYTHLTLPTN